jgi:hypothetical protein
MKVSTSVWVAAMASWICVGVAHADGAAAVVATPAVVAVPVAAVAVTPVVVPTQEVAAETALAEAPAAVVAPAVVASAPVVIPVLQSPLVAVTATAEPAATVSAVAPPPVVAPVAAPAAPAPAPAPASRDGLADPFATPAATPLWTTNGTQPGGMSTSSTATTAPMPLSPQDPYGPHHHPRRPDDYRLGVGMMFGGGITDFESQSVREMTGTGGAWDVRLIFGQREVLALETAYVGSAHYISAAGLDNDAMLVSNGAEGALRLNIPIIDHGSIIEPFGFVGLGWSRYELTQTAYNHSNITTAENVMEVPYGAGLTMGSDGFLVDIRFTYRSTYYDQLMRVPSSASSTTGDSQRLNSWSLGAHIGFEF